MKPKENLLKKEENRGITLVALVVTIVVLLILAGITITMLFSDSGIITKAREAAEATKNAQSDTEKGLNDLAEELAVASGEYDWKLNEDGTKVVNKNYSNGIEIGSYVKYDCTPVDGSEDSYDSTSDKNGYTDVNKQTFTTAYYKNKDWIVLGVDNKGQLLLISDESVYEDEDGYYLNGKTGYENRIKELNTICDLYGHGKGATGGRMLTIEEVNNMTGLNGNNTDGKGTKCNEGQMNEYGNKVTYYWNGGDTPYYEYTNSEGLKSENLTGNYQNGFTYYDESTKQWKTSQKPDNASTTEKIKITTITSTDYSYDASKSSIKGSKLYEILFNKGSYWLDSAAVYTNPDCARWGIGSVDSSGVYACSGSLVVSNGDEDYDYYDVRPVVSLKSNVQLEKQTQSDKEGYEVYIIK